MGEFPEGGIAGTGGEAGRDSPRRLGLGEEGRSGPLRGSKEVFDSGARPGPPGTLNFRPADQQPNLERLSQDGLHPRRRVRGRKDQGARTGVSWSEAQFLA